MAGIPDVILFIYHTDDNEYQMADSTFLYFSYGSNLLKQRLTLQNPSAVFVNIAKLQNYKLTFRSSKQPASSRWKGGAATIVEDDNSCVWGTVWRLDSKHKESLDRQESWYNPFEVTVISPEEESMTCRTYQINESDDRNEYDNRPSPQYKDVIIRGAKQQGLPEHYMEYLENIEDNGYQGAIQIYTQVLKSLEEII